MERTTEATTAREIDYQSILNTALTMPGNTGDTYRRLYDYSTLNVLFVMMQGVEPQPIATWNRWKDLGRHVVKGAKAREIIRPITIQRKNEDGDVEATFTRFRPVKCIFPYSDTAGDALPPLEHRDWDADRALAALDIKRAPYQLFENNVQGISWGRNVALNPVAKFPHKTLVHEISHVILGHTTETNLAEYQTHRGNYEFGAEGTAHLVMNELEMLDAEQASVSRGYLQSWMRGQRPPDASIKEVFKATDAILKAGRLAVTEELAS